MLSAHLLNRALQCLPETCTPHGESFEITALRKPQNQCLKVCAMPGESLEKVVTESLLKRKCLTANRSTTNQSKPFTRDSHTIHKGFTQFWVPRRTIVVLTVVVVAECGKKSFRTLWGLDTTRDSLSLRMAFGSARTPQPTNSNRSGMRTRSS